MKEPLSSSFARSAVFAGMILLVFSCAKEPTVPNRTISHATRDQSTATTCQEVCSITADTRPFRAASAQTDTVGATVRLADFQIAGSAGSEIVLQLNADPARFSSGFLSDHRLVVTVDDQPAEYSYSELLAGAVVYRFAAQQTVRIRYDLPRHAGTVPNDRLSLDQQLTGRAQIVRANTPWASTATTTTDPTSCHVSAPGTYCGVAVAFSAYFPGSPFGEFQNPAGTGASEPITITFSQPVRSVAITIADPDFAGNTLTVTNDTGDHIYGFVGDNTPGTYTEYPIATAEQHVTSITLTPAPADYVAYLALSFTVEESYLTCTGPTNTSTIIRGQTVTCTVKGTNVVATGWNFSGPAYPTDTKAEVHNIPGPTSGNSWSGYAAASGTVSAAISVNGVPKDSIRATFTVQNRTGTTWQWRSVQGAWTFGNGTGNNNPPCFQDSLVTNGGGRTGWNMRKDQCDQSILTPLASEADKGHTLQAITSGPNTGLYFVKTVTYKMATESTINPKVKSGSNVRFTLLQPNEIAECKAAGVSTTVNFYDFNTRCKNGSANIAAFQNGLLLHEGYGAQAGSGHQAQLEMAASKPENDLYKIVEGVYAKGKAFTDTAVYKAADRLAVVLVSAVSSHQYVYNNWCGNVWRWSPPGNFWQTGPLTQSPPEHPEGVCM